MSADSRIAAGVVLCALVLSVLPAAWLTGSDWQTAILLLVVLVFGLPHGAFDLVLLRSLQPSRVTFFGGYLLLAGLIIGLWWVAPAAFLVVFFLLSALHFGDSDWPDASWLEKGAWGTAVVAVPVMVQIEEARNLLSYLAPWNVAAWMASVLAMAAIVSGLVLAVIGRRRLTQGAVLIALALLSWRTSVLLAFAVYFCGFHARLHLSHWLQTLRVGTGKATYVASAVVLIAVFVVLALLPLSLDKSIVPVVFVTLAGLTAPHMVTIYLARRQLA